MLAALASLLAVAAPPMPSDTVPDFHPPALDVDDARLLAPPTDVRAGMRFTGSPSRRSQAARRRGARRNPALRRVWGMR